MRPKTLILSAVAILFCVSSISAGSDFEDEVIRKYMKRYQKKHTLRTTWISGYFSLNRINRDNDYNKFANYETINFTDATIPWLGEAAIFGADFGLIFNKRFAWTVGLEYWLKVGTKLEGSYFYEPTGSYVENPETKVQVFGGTTGFQCYLWNPPSNTGELEKLAVRTGVSVGLYKAKWEVWEEYQNLNLATSTTDFTTASFEDQTIGFGFNFGIDYPTRAFGLILGIDMGYLYLDFDNVALYNEWDQEIIATYTGDEDGRVDLGLSGVKGKIELKRFFSW